MPREYRPEDWYWKVGDGPAEQVYASARKAWVPEASDPDYLALLAGGDFATVIATQAELRDELERHDVAFLALPLRALEIARPRVHRARARFERVAFSLASGAGAAVQWSPGGFDPLGMWNPAQPDRITIPLGQGGTYLVTIAASFAASPVGDRGLQLRRNANPVRGGTLRQRAPAALSAEMFGTRPVILQGGDVLRVAWAQDSGGDLVSDALCELGRIE